jgi:hypothetical protein
MEMSNKNGCELFFLEIERNLKATPQPSLQALMAPKGSSGKFHFAGCFGAAVKQLFMSVSLRVDRKLCEAFPTKAPSLFSPPVSEDLKALMCLRLETHVERL